MQGPEGGDASRRTNLDDEVTLKLKVYRGLGIEVERGTEGEYGKAIVRSVGRGDVSVVSVDGKFSKFFYANYFWDQL
jgi:kinetochore protein Spc24